VRWTREELETWGGREALDADAEPVGHIYAVFVDDDSRAARWLAVRTGAHGDDVTPVPVDGAEPTGAAIRLPHPAATIRAAAHVAPGRDLTPEEDRQLVAFYGLAPAPTPSPRPAGGGPGVDAAVLEGLRSAHALEREAYNRLQSLISTLEDAELQHDVARHLTETEGHAAAVSGRLEQLESAPSSLQDALGVVTGKGASMAGAIASGKDPGDLLRDALAFERRECAVYTELAATARGAGDGATAEIAEKIRADEEAMAETVAGALRRMGQPTD
jgi:ferritin-like metal-binding protein YciE